MRGQRVAVGPFAVDDLTRAGAVDAAIRLALDGRRARFFALHVGGLNHRADSDFVREMNAAELVCADGGSVVLLAKLAGASHVERVPTTDVGLDVLRTLAGALGRPPRVVLIGGEPGLADEAGRALASMGIADVIAAEHGFYTDWDGVLDRIRNARPDVCVVGMGAPLEMIWVGRYLDALPEALVMTCGGWFGFLAGTETRAPAWLRRSGVEWVARVVQAPTRLGPRYTRGVASTVLMAFSIAWRRWIRRIPPGDAAAPPAATTAKRQRSERGQGTSEADHATAG